MKSMKQLIENLTRIAEEKETYLVLKRGKGGTLFLTGGGKWSPEYPDAKIFDAIGAAEKAAKKAGGEAVAMTDFEADNY